MKYKTKKNGEEQSACRSLIRFSRTDGRYHFMISALGQRIGDRARYIGADIRNLRYQDQEEKQDRIPLIYEHDHDDRDREHEIGRRGIQNPEHGILFVFRNQKKTP